MSKKENFSVCTPNSSLLHISIFHFCLGFRRRSSHSDDAEEALREMLWWPTAAARAGSRGVAQGVLSRLLVPCMSCTHRRQFTSGRRWAHRSTMCMTCMVRTVLIIRLQQPRVHLLRLPLSATKAFSAKLLRHRH